MSSTVEPTGVMVVNRFIEPDADAAEFRESARAALAALADRPGFVRGRFAGSLDEPDCLTLVTEWESVGAYRRALSAYDVKMFATPLLARARPEPSAFEVLLSAEGGVIAEHDSDRAPGIGHRDGEPGDPAAR
ncbi:antibiotic biosynthesis monooxygenase family protein [Stackebrandtia albiflava]|nr:antibiotic biosynthesis monooxygenase [Stackebrandtia albiflava]